MATRTLPPIHPGEVLMKEFLEPLGISQYRLATDVSVPPRRINEIVLGKRGVSADTALRLARFFGTSAEFWVNLQSLYELDVARRAIDRHWRVSVRPLKIRERTDVRAQPLPGFSDSSK